MSPNSATADSQVRLPGVNDRPDADVVIYDGQCVFCTGQVERLARWDRRGSLAFLSLHDSLVAERYPDLSHEQLMDRLYVVDQQGRKHGGAAAFRYLSRKLPRLWLIAPIMHIPCSLPLWQWCYRQVAKRRYRIAGKDACDGDACEVHLK